MGPATDKHQAPTHLLKGGGAELLEAIHNIFHKSWEKDSFSADWRIAAVNFLKKPGKNVITKHPLIGLLVCPVVWENT